MFLPMCIETRLAAVSRHHADGASLQQSNLYSSLVPERHRNPIRMVTFKRCSEAFLAIITRVHINDTSRIVHWFRPRNGVLAKRSADITIGRTLTQRAQSGCLLLHLHVALLVSQINLRVSSLRVLQLKSQLSLKATQPPSNLVETSSTQSAGCREVKQSNFTIDRCLLYQTDEVAW